MTHDSKRVGQPLRIDAQLHYRLKVRSAELRLTMREFAEALLRKGLDSDAQEDGGGAGKPPVEKSPPPTGGARKSPPPGRRSAPYERLPYAHLLTDDAPEPDTIRRGPRPRRRSDHMAAQADALRRMREYDSR